MNKPATPPSPSQQPFQRVRSFLHPATGVLILVADWFFFSGTVVTGGALVAHAMFFGFIVGFAGATYIQLFLARERWQRAVLKGLLAGGLVGFPIPVGGTIIGGLILAFSGLDQLRQQLAHALAEEGTEGEDGDAPDGTP